MIFVPKGTEGMEMKPIDTMGGRETNTVYFNDCEVPAEQLLGEQDRGWMQLMAGLNVERLILAATMLGIGQRAFDDALAYAKERKQFGRPIGNFQALQHRFADLATELEAARLMTHWVASLTDEDPDSVLPKESSMVKLFVTETAQQVALAGMQMMGGYGYSSEYDMERLVRATLVSTIYGGTSEIQRGIIAKTLGLWPSVWKGCGSAEAEPSVPSAPLFLPLPRPPGRGFFSSGGASTAPTPTFRIRGDMASDVRIAVTLACEECKRRNYETNKSRRNYAGPDRDAQVLPLVRTAHAAQGNPLARAQSQMAKTRAQRKAEKRRREAQPERERKAGGDGAERDRESRAQHDTQAPVSGEVAEAEAVIETGARPEDYGEHTVEHEDQGPTQARPPCPASPRSRSPRRRRSRARGPRGPAPSRADVGAPTERRRRSRARPARSAGRARSARSRSASRSTSARSEEPRRRRPRSPRSAAAASSASSPPAGRS